MIISAINLLSPQKSLKQTILSFVPITGIGFKEDTMLCIYEHRGGSPSLEAQSLEVHYYNNCGCYSVLLFIIFYQFLVAASLALAWTSLRSLFGLQFTIQLLTRLKCSSILMMCLIHCIWTHIHIGEKG